MRCLHQQGNPVPRRRLQRRSRTSHRYMQARRARRSPRQATTEYEDLTCGSQRAREGVNRCCGGAAGFSGRIASAGLNTSTDTMNLRCSPAGMAPTPTTWREISSPRSLVIDTITAYSHASSPLGWRIDPSTRRGEKVGTIGSPPGANRRCFLQEGQTLVLCRITARQCGQVRVAPAGVLRSVLTRRDELPG